VCGQSVESVGSSMRTRTVQRGERSSRLPASFPASHMPHTAVEMNWRPHALTPNKRFEEPLSRNLGISISA
jgi:hypothetical protein